jgi:hypothetical protein
MSKLQMNPMLITFFDIKGIVCFHSTKPNSQPYLLFICGHIEAVNVKLCRRRPELLPSDWFLHNSASAHKALSVKQFLPQKLSTEVEHPSYSPYLAQNDFWLFPKIKSTLKGRRFQDTDNVQKNVMLALKAVPQQQFQKCSQQWEHHWAA